MNFNNLKIFDLYIFHVFIFYLLLHLTIINLLYFAFLGIAWAWAILGLIIFCILEHCIQWKIPRKHEVNSQPIGLHQFFEQVLKIVHLLINAQTTIIIITIHRLLGI